MNILNEVDFQKTCGKMVPLRRDMSNFDGDNFKCSCGAEHTFYSYSINVLSEGFNGKFLVACPDHPNILSLIKTKMRFGIIYQGLELLAGHEITEQI